MFLIVSEYLLMTKKEDILAYQKNPVKTTFMTTFY